MGTGHEVKITKTRFDAERAIEAAERFPRTLKPRHVALAADTLGRVTMSPAVNSDQSEHVAKLRALLAAAGDVRDAEGEALAEVAADAGRVRHVIVRCFAAEPGDDDGSDVSGRENGERAARRVVNAVRRVAEGLGTPRVWVAVDRDAGPRVRRLWRRAVADVPMVRVKGVGVAHPGGHPVMLARAVAGVTVAVGKSARQVGVLVVSAAAMERVGECLESGKSGGVVRVAIGLNDRIVKRVDAREGESIDGLVEQAVGESKVVRIVAGGWATGRVVEDDERLSSDVTTLWAFDHVPHREAIPCVRCGACVDECPVGLSPIAIYDAVAGHATPPVDQPAGACIGCGVCTYVCPSELPLAATVREQAPAAHAERARMIDPPQWVSGATYRSMLTTWLIAALPPTAAGLIFFGTEAGKMILAAVGAAMATEALFARARSAAVRGNLVHAGLMGLLVALTLPANGPLAAAVLGGVVAVGFGKIALGGIGRYLWQPALIGRVVVQFLFAQQLSFSAGLAHSPVLANGRLVFGELSNATIVEGRANQGWSRTLPDVGDDAISEERPVQMLRRLASGGASNRGESAMVTVMRDELPPWQDTLIGTVGGGIGETSTVALIVSVLYLIARGAVRWSLPTAILMMAFLMAWVCPIRPDLNGGYVWLPGSIWVERWPVGLMYVAYHMTAGQLMLGAALLAGDPTSSPLTGRGQWLFGLGIGAITIFMRLYGMMECECYWAILIMNTLVPMIDRITRPRVWRPAAA